MVEDDSPLGCDLNMWFFFSYTRELFMSFLCCHQGYQGYGSGRSVRAAGGVYMEGDG
ncbi:MAG TPA: hypothetical protein PK024_12075 [Methanospirillum sp.]|uniref:hypothetical protein n=1 Tax=Methanospirillum sp. TaxID=45200 RepID=UPI002CDC3A9F|nr:hypothetical protein [Methanospirillum sp.]HOJ97560.1 hypothetical protein [Methanospirillum sp.]